MLFCAGQGRPALGAKKRFNFGVLLQNRERCRRVRLGCRDVDYVVKLWDKEDLSGLSYNARAWAKFGRPEKRSRFSRAAEFGRARMAEPGPQGPQRFLRCGWFSKRRC